MGERLGVAAPPRRHRRQSQRLTEQVLAGDRGVREQRGVLEHAGAESVDDAHPVAAYCLGQAGHPQLRVAAQLQRVAPRGVDPAQDDVDPLQPAECLHQHPAVADGEVAALHEREAEVGGERRLVVRRLRVRARRQDDDPRVGELAMGGLEESGAERPEVRRHPVQVRLAIELGQHPAQHFAVLERVAEAGRCLGAVAEDPPGTGRVAAEIGRGRHQRAGIVARAVGHDPGEARVRQHRGGGEDPVPEQGALAVQVDEHGVEELGPLGEPDLDFAPGRGVDDERHRVEPPGGRTFAGPGVGHPVVGEEPHDLLVDPPQVAGADAGRDRRQSLPRRPQDPVGADDFVVPGRLAAQRRLGERGDVLPQDRHGRNPPMQVGNRVSARPAAGPTCAGSPRWPRRRLPPASQRRRPGRRCGGRPRTGRRGGLRPRWR